MKKNIFFLCCFFIVNFSFSQTAAKFYKQGDSLYEAKDYKNSAIAYTKGIKQEGKATSIGKYYACACSWSLAGIPDSAFHDLDIIAASGELTIQDAREIENDNDFTLLKTDKRWQLTIDSMYKKALGGTKKLSEDVREGNRINSSIDKYNIAVAWALAKNKDSAFSYLSSIINTNYNRFIAYNSLLEEKAFNFLYNDPRWKQLVDEVNKHKLPFTCAHASSPSGSSMIFTIDTKSKFLRNDGEGSYIDNEDKVSSRCNFSYNLMVSGVNELNVSGNWKDASSRYLILDLNSPIRNSGAIKQGIIKDHFAAFHTWYKIDTAATLDLIYNFRDIPIGATIESPRTEIMIHINRKLFILELGFWSLGDCGEVYGCGGKINGNGTTPVKITRHSETSYTIEAPNGSIGRLWDADNRTMPVDNGLFKTGFIIHVENE